MKALITGQGGQLARSLSNSVVGDHEVSLHPIDTMDITSAEQVEEAVNDFRPDVIINTAAYTAVAGVFLTSVNNRLLDARLREQGKNLRARNFALRRGSNLGIWSLCVLVCLEILRLEVGLTYRAARNGPGARRGGELFLESRHRRRVSEERSSGTGPSRAWQASPVSRSVSGPRTSRQIWSGG